MFSQTFLKGTSALRALACAGAIALPFGAMAGEVNLKSADGTVNLVGELVRFQNNSYVIRTQLGEMIISAQRVRCEGAACPTFETAEADVVFAGSETLGQGMMPLLIEGYAGFLDADSNVKNTAVEGELLAELVGDQGYGDKIGSYLVSSTASSDAFRRLLDETSEVGLSSRRIRALEARELSTDGAGNMFDPSQEHIVAVDGLVVITHPTNPVDQLTTAQLAAIYSGKIQNWSQVGGRDAPIKVYDRSSDSGAREVFGSAILNRASAPSLRGATIKDDNTDMSIAVNEDPNAIGYVSYAFQRGAKPLTLINECGITMTPDAFSARTEEYVLQRRLYMYNRADTLSEGTREFLDFVTSEEADGVIAKAGFIDLGIDRRGQGRDSARYVSLKGKAPEAAAVPAQREMSRVMQNYDRLSTTFRFTSGSARLDERGRSDLRRLTSFLEAQPKGSRVMIVGFTDTVGGFNYNLDLAERRAKQVREELETFAGSRLSGLNVATKGYGEIASTACNATDEGRRINRRVEIWIENSAS